MEGLSRMIRVAKSNEWIKGFDFSSINGYGLEIFHLVYGDDTNFILFFCDEVDQISHLRANLTIFEALSGLHVNWSKCSIFPVSQVPLANNLGCQVTGGIFTYQVFVYAIGSK